MWPYRLTQNPFSHTRPDDPHPDSAVQGRGHGPTALTGADVNSVREPAAQKMSTGRPSQPQRPPGSMQCASLLGTTHRPLLPQPDVNPHRWPDGHCESFVQLTTLREAPFLEESVFAVWHSASPMAAKSQRTRLKVCANADHGFFITLERGPCGFLRPKLGGASR
jgi:hypothetical protein